MRVYLDTEFTQLNDGKLISLGLVSENSERTFYAELTDSYKLEDCSDFVVETVLPLLDAPDLPEKVSYRAVYAKMTRAQCREHLGYWIAAIQEPVQINSDAPNLDWPLFKELFAVHPWPAMLDPECRNCFPSALRQELYLAEEEKYYARSMRRHHALDDAIVMRHAAQAVEKASRASSGGRNMSNY